MRIWLIISCLSLSLMISAQHKFGFEGGANIPVGPNPVLTHYGSALYSTSNPLGMNIVIEAQYSLERFTIEHPVLDIETEYLHKMRLIPALEIKLTRFFSINAGLNFGFRIARSVKRTSMREGQVLVLIDQSPWDVAVTPGARIHFGNAFISMKYNLNLVNSQRFFSTGLTSSTVGIVNATNMYQIGVGYIFDPKEALKKMK